VSSKEVKYDNKKLQDFLRALNKKLPEIKVGIVGDGAIREGSVSNAEVGAYHEYGTSKHPQRSFLRMPLSTQLNKELETAGAFKEGVAEEIIAEKGLKGFAKKLAGVAVETVKSAFDTGGYGKWPSIKGTNNTGQILVDTTQLRESISEETT